MAMITINGVQITPEPSKLDPETADLQQNATRAASGTMVFDLIRSNLRSFNIEWAHMTPVQLKALYEAWGERAYNPVTLFDSVTGEMSTRTYYRGNISAVAMRADDTGKITDYINVKMKLVEV